MTIAFFLAVLLFATRSGFQKRATQANDNWFDPKSYPSVPYVVDLLMDPMEKATPNSEEFGYAGRMFLAQKLWAPTGAGPFLAAHLKSLQDFPPSQGADTLSMKKAVDEAMKKLENPAASSN